MELKDMILSTLAELEDGVSEASPANNAIKPHAKKEMPQKPIKDRSEDEPKQVAIQKDTNSEIIFLTSIRERLLVLFEGFQAPNNSNIEAKVDMTLNFLEYVLATIDTRVESIQKGEK